MNTKKRTRSLCLLLCAALMLTACAKVEYASYELTPNEYLMDEDGREVYSPAGGGAQLTAEDIQRMNGDKAHLMFNDAGYLTFLNGKFSDQKIEDHEDAVAALNGVATLLGLGAGSEFFAKYGGKDDGGYTYYTFQQRYGDMTVLNGTLKIVVDPEGYTAGLSCSFTPNMGIAEDVGRITPEQAADVIKSTYSELELTYYPEYTAEVAFTYQTVVYSAYAVYTNNPDMTKSFDIAYYEHFVSFDGEYLYSVPVASPTTKNAEVYQAEAYFEGLEPATYSGDVLLYDGSVWHIDVPIAYNPADGLYYLCDLERRIMVADYYAFAFQSRTLKFITSTDGKSFMNNHLITYANYIRAYDFYNGLGITSVDDFGTPILVCVGYCDENKVPVNNACHFGIIDGWACFASSDAYTYSEALDVIAHEYTHGVTRYALSGSCYQNATGAINEAYSDIMGNICEMLSGATRDTQWLLAENTGEVLRSMSAPNDYYQPVSLSDPYYMPPTETPTMDNDLGGVHINSSLLSSVAYKICAAGMSLADASSLWATTIELITPLSEYEEVYAALLMSLEINGFDEGYQQVVTDAFNDAELLG